MSTGAIWREGMEVWLRTGHASQTHWYLFTGSLISGSETSSSYIAYTALCGVTLFTLSQLHQARAAKHVTTRPALYTLFHSAARKSAVVALFSLRQRKLKTEARRGGVPRDRNCC